MATGQKDEKRFLLERGDKNLSAAPQKNQAEREDLRAKTRSGEREGKRKKDKNQNLQTDKCIFKFLFNLTSVFSVRLPSWSNTTLSFDVLIGQRGQSGFFFGASSSWEDDREEKRRTSASVCLSLSCKQAEKRCCDHWAVLLSELWDRKICPPPPLLLLCGEEENGWREEMYLTGEEGGCQPQEETAERGDRRGQGGQEERKRGWEDRKKRKQGRRGEIGEWTRRWRKGKGRGDEEGNKIRTGKVSKRKGVEPRKWGQEKKIQGDKERAREEEEER